MTIKELQAPVAAEMIEFEKKFRTYMKSNVFLLDKILRYIVRRKGKQLRPLFVFLTAKMCGEVSEKTYRGAALIELLHTATLVHDDVVDDADMRRGFFSINALWKNKIAVLVGDFLLSRGLLMAVDNDDFDLLKTVSHAVREMSEGELLQLEKARRPDAKEDVYYEIIRQKTASLIASCCVAGVQSVGASEDTVKKARLFGEKVGMAFQIKDDLFDYGSLRIGKPVGIDIRDQKFTLPLIYALNNSSRSEKRRIINLVKNKKATSADVRKVIEFTEQKGGIEYATEKMLQFRTEAEELLKEFPPSENREAIGLLIRFITERKN